MIKKLSVSLSILILASLSLASFVNAQSPSIERILPPSDVNSFLGQNHDYSITFRGNGEAVVALRVSFTNKANESVKTYELRIPERVQVSQTQAFQVIKADLSPVYPQDLRYYGQNKYQKAETEFSGDTLKITLPNSIAKDGAGAFFVYLRAAGYTKKDVFGSYEFRFETFKISDSIQNLRVGISTDSDLILKGGSGEVNYRFDVAEVTSLSSKSAGAAVPSTEVDSFYNQIGYGSINKNASNLDSMESYEVSGAYAKNRATLYAKEIILGGVATALVALVGFTLGRRLVRGTSTMSPFAFSFIASLVSALLVGLFSVVLWWLSTNMARYMPWYYGGFDFLILVVAVVAFAIYVFLLVGPAVLVGARKGIGWGFATLGMSVGWLILFVVVFGVIGLLTKGGGSYPGPIIPLRSEPAVMEKNLVK